jgi:hypothetical protein
MSDDSIVSAYAELARLRAEVEAFKNNNRYHRGHSAGYAEAKDDCAAELLRMAYRAEKAEAALAIERQTLSGTIRLKMHFEVELASESKWAKEYLDRAERAEAERDRADAEVAELKKLLLEFGQLPSTPP